MIAPAVLMVLGVVVAAVSLAADLLMRSENPSIGVSQVLVAGAGVAMFLNGLSLRREEGRRRVDAFLALDRKAQLTAIARFLVIVVQLALLFQVLAQFQIENEAFYRVLAALAFGGFFIHHLVPPAYRMGFLLALSIVAMTMLFGLQDGVWLVLAGTGLVLLCYLPIPFAWCIGLVFVAGVLLAIGRAGALTFPWSDAIWPILGSMFMFRMVVFLYDVYHAEKRPPLVESLSYFFMLPNLTFPFFPVVDFTVYRRTYYDAASFEIYEKGVKWMFRGVVQLVLYRLVYQYGTMPMNEVQTAGDLARYMLANFGLYIRVSGQFHLVVGMLHLFGFNLPPTHNRYYLASSITDLWRRINIYWKDFMQKLVFNPVYFRLRGRGDTQALVIGVVAVFIVTWAAHGYQWFWLLGSFPITGPDTLFWGILGVVMVFNTVREARRGRVRRLAPQRRTPREMVPLALRTAGTFAFICILWSLWSSPTLADWVALITL